MPDEKEHPCPQCGTLLDRCEDNYGITYQCPNHACMTLFEADEIEEGDDGN
jgi:hypothetical protein